MSWNGTVSKEGSAVVLNLFGGVQVQLESWDPPIWWLVNARFLVVLSWRNLHASSIMGVHTNGMNASSHLLKWEKRYFNGGLSTK